MINTLKVEELIIKLQNCNHYSSTSIGDGGSYADVCENCGALDEAGTGEWKYPKFIEELIKTRIH